MASSQNGPWWEFVKAVEDFNDNQRKTVAALLQKTLDEVMSAWHTQTTQTGGLPNLSFIEQKPELLGIEFKSISCALMGIMLGLEIQRGKFILLSLSTLI